MGEVSSPQGLLLGRELEVRTLADAVEVVGAGRGGSIWLEGEPGIGKSAVVSAVLTRAAAAGCAVMRGVGERLSQSRPLGALLDCRQDPASEDGHSGQTIGHLLGVHRIGALTASDAYRVVEFVESWCARRPMLLLVDDLHWVDDASLLVWGHLSEVARQAPLLLLAASRPVPARVEVNRLREALVATGSRLLELGPLAPPVAVTLAGQLAGAQPGPRFCALVGRAGGNPLYIKELTEALLRSGGVLVRDGVAELAPAVGDRVPGSLATAIERRLGLLSEAVLDMLRAAATLGVEFSVSDLSAVFGRSAADLVPSVTEAVACGVLVEVGDRLAFRHGLIRQVLYDAVPLALRAALHRQAARALAEHGIPVVRVAEQLLTAARAGAGEVADGWVTDWLGARGATLAYQAPELAQELLGLVAGVPGVEAVVRQRLNLAWLLALDMLRRNDVVVESAPAMLADATAPEVAGEIAWRLGLALQRSGRDAEAVALIDQVLESWDLPVRWSARLRVLSASTQTWIATDGGHDLHAAGALMQQAELDAGRAGDRYGVVYALFGQVLICPTDWAGMQRRLDLVDRALAAAKDVDEAVNLRTVLRTERILALEALDRPADAGRAFQEAAVIAERETTPRYAARVRHAAAEWLLLHGRWDEAIVELDVPYTPDASESTSHYAIGLRALLALHRDETAELAHRLRIIDELDFAGRANFLFAWHLLVAQALAAEREGRTALALSRLAGLLDRAVQPGRPAVDQENGMWLPDGVRLAMAEGDHATARRLSELAQACAAEKPTLVPEAIARHCAALVDADPVGARAAADLYDQCERSFFAAQARENAAVLYAVHGDIATARTVYTEAVATYTQLNAVWDQRRGDARLRRYGIRRIPRATLRPTRGWAALTPVELQVAEQVAAGRSNPEIAREMFLSAHTVRAHVSHILAKLQAHSRVEIAREAERQRLHAPIA